MDARFDDVRSDPLIGAHRRQKHVLVEPVVEPVHAAVETFPGIRDVVRQVPDIVTQQPFRAESRLDRHIALLHRGGTACPEGQGRKQQQEVALQLSVCCFHVRTFYCVKTLTMWATLSRKSIFPQCPPRG